MVIPQGTTPDITCRFNIDLVDLSEAHNIYLTLAQNGRKLRKSGDSIAIIDNCVCAFLSQKETLWLDPDKEVQLEVNWTYSNGKRGKSVIKSLSVDETLEKEVLE